MHFPFKTLMVQGTTSDAGKTTVVAALCRLLKPGGRISIWVYASRLRLLLGSELQSIFFARSRNQTEVLLKYLRDDARARQIDQQRAMLRQPPFPALQRMLDLSGEFNDVIRLLNMPPSYVILDRVVWGMSALFGRMGVTHRWGDLLDEYLHHAPPSTELGRAEVEWRRRRLAAAPL